MSLRVWCFRNLRRLRLYDGVFGAYGPTWAEIGDVLASSCDLETLELDVDEDPQGIPRAEDEVDLPTFHRLHTIDMGCTDPSLWMRRTFLPSIRAPCLMSLSIHLWDSLHPKPPPTTFLLSMSNSLQRLMLGAVLDCKPLILFLSSPPPRLEKLEVIGWMSMETGFWTTSPPGWLDAVI